MTDKKPPTDVIIPKQMRPRDANTHGTVFGGEILRNMDEAGALAAEQYAGTDVVTASINRMSFEQPVRTDDLLIVQAAVEYVGDTSITVGVDVYAEDVQADDRRKTADAYLTYVAQDEDGNTVEVPDLQLETDKAEEQYETAQSMQQEACQQSSIADLPEPDEWDISYPSRMRPRDSNKNGNVIGGEILQIMDEAAGIAAARYAGEGVVTASLDTMSFEEPVYTDDLLIVNANVDYVGTSSMVVAVDIQAEDVRSGERRTTGSAYMTFVALDDDGNPIPVPDLTPATDAAEERYKEAEAFRDDILDSIDG